MRYMRRCIQLAQCGRLNARPNPMVGAVIVYGSTIIGEGYHVRCGEGHAEVNAFASVKPEHEHLLPESTIYVSLEPCSHYGKTPPCADLIIKKGVKRVVVGCVDPFAKVQGRGIQKLRDAGIEVEVGVCEEECRTLNRVFFTFHSLHRPYITLKWAESNDGFIGCIDPKSHMQQAAHISNAYTQMLCHKLRAEHQAILIGHKTYTVDQPSLTTRAWSGPNPQKILLTNKPDEIADDSYIIVGGELTDVLTSLYERGIQSVLVEGGSNVLNQFITQGLWDEAYVEQGTCLLGCGTAAPTIPPQPSVICEDTKLFGHKIRHYSRK